MFASRFVLAAALCAALASAASAQSTLRIGLAEDPDILDPTLARTYVGRIVFASLCDKLFDIDENVKIVPQLDTAYAISHYAKEVRNTHNAGVVFDAANKYERQEVKVRH